MKKPMTVDELAGLIMNTMASKEDLIPLATKEDLKKLATKEELEIFKNRTELKFSEVTTKLNRIDNRLDSVESYKITQLELIKRLREKRVLTTEESQSLLTV